MLFAPGSHMTHLLFETVERIVKCTLELRAGAGRDNFLAACFASDLDFVVCVAFVPGGVPGDPNVNQIVVALVREGVNALLDLCLLFVANPFRLVPVDLQVCSFLKGNDGISQRLESGTWCC